MTPYSTYRTRCAALEREIETLRPNADQHTATIKYLVEGAESFICAAKMLIKAREEFVSPELQAEGKAP